MSLLPDYTEIDQLRAEVARLTAELADVAPTVRAVREYNVRLEKELAELRAQENQNATTDRKEN